MEKLSDDHQFSTKAIYDMALVRRALKEDDQKAYDELMKRYWEPVYYMLLRMMNNNADNAEDLTMEAFGKAFINLEKYSPVCAFSTWVFKIASNNAIDFIRANKMYKGTLSMDRPVESDSSENFSAYIKGKELNPEETLIRKQTIDRVRIVIDKLKPKNREIVELYYLEELTHDEIAAKLDLPVNTVKTRLFRSKDLLLTIAQRQKRF
jgi:RNA polymerase sigma-70 factor (ECF subfamily)